MTILLNGTPTETQTARIDALLAELGLAEMPIIIELNGDALLKSEHSETSLHDGDRLEIITLAAGG